jgi:hypothetical protein
VRGQEGRLLIRATPHKRIPFRENAMIGITQIGPLMAKEEERFGTSQVVVDSLCISDLSAFLEGGSEA